MIRSGTPAALPEPPPLARAASDALQQRILQEIDAGGGWIGFDRYMTLALYASGLGYYSGGAQKFGAAGDFVTAPELSPLFGQTLAVPLARIMAQSAPHLIEVGAGSGRLAADLLTELEATGALPETYGILDLSGELRERQAQLLNNAVPHLIDRVYWLDRLPEHFDGAVFANELLDAMPAHLVFWNPSANPDGEMHGATDEGPAIIERGVGRSGDSFIWSDRPAQGRLLDRAHDLRTELGLAGSDSPPYLSEIAFAPGDWVAAWAGILGTGALLLVDYGFPRHEYYHPQRSGGTLMCHYRHRAHADPFFLPGLQDITVHVDFTALADAAFAAGLDILGYTSQAAFLLDCGLPAILQRYEPEATRHYLPHAQAANKLVAPAEMGELFKVMALGKGIVTPLTGFGNGDRRERL